MFDAIVYPESSYELRGADNIRNYLLGGKGVVTLQSPSGIHRTYAFNRPRYQEQFDEGTMFIYAQVSSGVWNYVGMLTPEHIFRVTRNSRYELDHPITKGAAYIVKMMNGRITDTPMILYHCGVCSICGRKLTDPKSIAIGMGPKCRKHVVA